MALGENIRRRRKKLGLTQKELSEKAGVTILTIQRYEKKSENDSVRKNTLEKIANALGVDVNELFSRESFGEMLKNARDDKGLSVSELAAAVDVNDETYRKYESDTALPPMDVLQKMDTLLGLSVTSHFADYMRHYDKIEPNTQRQGFQFHSTKDKIINKIDVLNDTGQQKLLESANILAKVPEYLKTYHNDDK